VKKKKKNRNRKRRWGKMMEKEARLYTLDGKPKRKKRLDSLTDVKIPINQRFKDLLHTKASLQQVALSELTVSCIYSALDDYRTSLHTLRMPHLALDYQYDNDNPHIHVRIPYQMLAKIVDVKVANRCSQRKACFILLVHNMYDLGWIK
jgi:hypothetical protein